PAADRLEGDVIMSEREPQRLQIGELPVRVYADPQALGAAAATDAASAIRAAVAERGEAHVILATGTSQVAFLEALATLPDLPWTQVELYHMDEYVGLAGDHAASFRRFLRERIVDLVGPRAFHEIRGDAPPEAEAARYGGLVAGRRIDLTCMGIGENGHLAFNDPPDARFDDPQPARVVRLDEASRRQQVGEGHFPDLGSVPTHAITLTIPTLLAATRVQVVVPEARKAEAVRRALRKAIDEACPASVLRRVPHATLYLDRDAAGGL
ncbi:MAG: 6-phosphogluconolactonase, partial [Trueperaceae bacterium]|nr:6-phosphogluconolactonase [Trueperaceae bacterium]